eukprot:63565-Rhodomonas_salina.3
MMPLMIWPDCPPALPVGDFVPDGIILSYSHPLSKFPSRVVIVEFRVARSRDRVPVLRHRADSDGAGNDRRGET